MSLPAFMSIRGQYQGDITQGASTIASIGGKSREDHENEIIVQGFEHQIMTPIDVHTGSSFGKRVHKELKILKQFDKTTPLLLHALCTNEQLTATIRWYRISFKGDEEPFFTVSLEGAVCCGMERHMANCLDPSNHFHEPMEWVSFAYRRITMTHEGSRTEFSDEWGTVTGH